MKATSTSNKAKEFPLGLTFQTLISYGRTYGRTRTRCKSNCSCGWCNIKKILTWENLQKTCLVGPSRCQLCGIQEEMMDHLLNLCPFTSTLWNWVVSIFRRTNKDEFSITGTLKNWKKDFSENEIINKAWTLVLGFLI